MRPTIMRWPASGYGWPSKTILRSQRRRKSAGAFSFRPSPPDGITAAVADEAKDHHWQVTIKVGFAVEG